jgi:hypothetical protein
MLTGPVNTTAAITLGTRKTQNRVVTFKTRTATSSSGRSSSSGENLVKRQSIFPNPSPRAGVQQHSPVLA